MEGKAEIAAHRLLRYMAGEQYPMGRQIMTVHKFIFSVVLLLLMIAGVNSYLPILLD
jgi:hypothetical protein